MNRFKCLMGAPIGNLFIRLFALLFCLFPSAYAEIRFLALSDIHYGFHNASKDGEDTGPDFLKETLKKYKQLSKNVDFILYLGDLPDHFIFSSVKKGQLEKKVFHELYSKDSHSKPIFYITGNNDSLAGNYSQFATHGITPLHFATDWNGACAHCNGLIIDDHHLYQDGYYSTYVIPHNKEIILIGLNANQWAKSPLLLSYPKQKKDALQQLSWLETQLKNHHAKQLLIAVHEPPGYSYRGTPIWHPTYVRQFTNLLKKYKESYGEINLLSAHTHMDELRRIHFTKGSTIYNYSIPGISRIHHNYPGMKVFHLNEHLKIKNFITYYTSHLNQWENQQYQAIHSMNAIFPQCKNTLAQCLNHLNTKQVCDHLNAGFFYGVKNPKVPNKLCNKTYNVLAD